MQNPAGPAPTGPFGTGFLQTPANTPFATLNSSGGQNGALPGMGLGTAAVPGMGGGPPSFPIGQGSNNIIQQILSTRIPTGTVLTGTLHDDLSSHKSQVGDLFSIILDDGFFLNGIEVIPRRARIIGTVVSVTGSSARGGMGMPGNVSIGLTTLVFPDGRSMPFGGVLDHNPAAIQKQPPKVVNSGFGLGSYGQQLGSMFGSFGNVGYMRALRNRGPEFDIKAGTLVPVRVNRTLDLTKMVAPLVPPGGTPGGPMGSDLSQAMPGSMPPGTVGSGTPGGLTADPTALRIPTTQGGQPLLPRELPEPF